MAKEEQAQSEQTEKKGPPLKAIIIVVLILVAEAVALALYQGSTKKKAVSADETTIEEQVKSTSAELEILNDLQIPNRRTGRLVMYDIQVAIELDEDKKEELKELVAQHEIRIKDLVYTIVAQAEPYYFEEPDRQTLKRQIRTALEDEFGEGHIKRVLIPKLISYAG